MSGDHACRIGVDVGGTFTDLVLVTEDGSVARQKVLSTSGNYTEAIFAGIREVLQEAGVARDNVKELIHGTTVATNAIIERRGARTGLVTTEGFRDLLEIGRLRLMRLYDMDQERPAPDDGAPHRAQARRDEAVRRGPHADSAPAYQHSLQLRE